MDPIIKRLNSLSILDIWTTPNRVEYVIEGGDIGPEWQEECAKSGRPPWCEIAVWSNSNELGSYGGEVRPTAWPNLFQEKVRNSIEITQQGWQAIRNVDCMVHRLSLDDSKEVSNRPELLYSHLLPAIHDARNQPISILEIQNSKKQLWARLFNLQDTWRLQHSDYLIRTTCTAQQGCTRLMSYFEFDLKATVVHHRVKLCDDSSMCIHSTEELELKLETWNRLQSVGPNRYRYFLSLKDFQDWRQQKK